MELDYKKIGLKCGLEVHQQLDTGKLFCRCPSIVRNDEPDIAFVRHIHPVASELGEYDPAALEAFSKGLNYKYEAYSDTTCLIEADCEPPQPMDHDALKAVLEIAAMLEAQIRPEIIVMRKTVVDGSNTAGFQRTSLVATNGKIKLKNKDLKVDTIVVEEDAGRTITSTEKQITYRIDRLGIPLIELATAPDLNLPEEVKEAAGKIGELFRITGYAKRGLGGIRQDVNVSVAGGTRVELKGVQELDLIDEYVKREAIRQLALVEIKELLAKKSKKEKIVNNEVDVTDILKNTEAKFVSGAIKEGKKVIGVKLPGFKGILGKEVQPGRTFGKEITGYTKMRAKVNGFLHSDELPKYGISAQETAEIAKKIGCSESDAFAIVCDEKEGALLALHVIVERCKLAFDTVPPETRNPLPEGNSEYSRPLPGAARMYPETDIRPIKVTKELLAEIKADLPLSADARIKLYKAKGLSEKLANQMKLSNYARFFDKLLGKGFDATQTATFLLDSLAMLKRNDFAVDEFSNHDLEEMLSLLKEGKINRDALLEIAKEKAGHPAAYVQDIAARIGKSMASDSDVRKIIAEIVSKNKALAKEKGQHAQGALMGDVMKSLRGKADGATISRILKEEIEKVSK